MLKITIPLEPRTKKNSQRIISVRGHYMIMPSKKYKEYEKACKDYIPEQKQKINFPISVKCLYYMPTKRRTDLTNLLEATDDILVYYGVLEDDNYNIIASHDGSRVLYDKENPRTEIYIEPFKE